MGVVLSCPGRASWQALHDHMRADVKIGAVKHTRDCTKITSEPLIRKQNCNRQPVGCGIGQFKRAGQCNRLFGRRLQLHLDGQFHSCPFCDRFHACCLLPQLVAGTARKICRRPEEMLPSFS